MSKIRNALAAGVMTASAFAVPMVASAAPASAEPVAQQATTETTSYTFPCKFAKHPAKCRAHRRARVGGPGPSITGGKPDSSITGGGGGRHERDKVRSGGRHETDRFGGDDPSRRRINPSDPHGRVRTGGFHHDIPHDPDRVVGGISGIPR